MLGPFKRLFSSMARSRKLKRSQELILLGREAEAVKTLSFLAEDNPDDFELLLWTAIALSQCKDYGRAGEAIDRALAICRDHPVAGMVKGEILISTGRYDEALSILGACLEKSPDNTRIAYLAGVAWLKKGDVEKASNLFESVVRFDRELVDSRLLAMAELYLHKNK